MFGRFITIEGGEYTGKTTQAKLLVDKLNTNGYKAMLVRDPGGTEICEVIRSILKNQVSKTEKLVPPAELFLYLASRAQMDHKILKPALNDGYICVSDRWIDSTMVYQCMIKQSVGKDLLQRIENEIMHVTLPNLTFILDVPIDEIMRRKNLRDQNAIVDDYDNADREFFEMLRQYYDDLMKMENASYLFNRYMRIDGMKSVEDISNEIYNFRNYIPLQFCYPIRGN